MSNLAAIYLKGIGGFENSYEKALELFNKAAILNDPRALFCLGTFYRDAKYGFEQDGQKAAEYFIRGAQHATIPEDVSNLLNLAAEIYRYGKGGVTPDAQKVIELYEKLEELESRGEAKPESNSEKALLKLAEIYTEGCGSLKLNARKALEYLLKVDDVFALIDFCREGKAGIKPNGYEVIECLSELSFRHMKTIAEIYRDGKAGVEPDPQKAIEYFLKHESTIHHPKNSNHEMSEFDTFLDNEERASAFRKIAEIYYSLNDGQKALEYFLKADKFGDEWAYINVAGIYREGKGNLKPDGVKLVEYLTKKLEQLESPDSIILYDIAKAHEEGCGSLEPNTQKALEFYRKAAALGNDFAKEELAIRKLL